jgi:hypothetical protein
MDRENLENVKQIAKNTSPKDSKQLTVTDNKSEFTVEYSCPIHLDNDKQYEIALINLETYYSFPNITEKNNKLKYYNGGTWKTITIPTGAYEIEAIDKLIKLNLKRNGDKETGIKLLANVNTLQSILDLEPGYKVDFTLANSLNTVLGFENKIYEGIHESERVVDILQVNAILVHLNIIKDSYLNGNTTPVIYSFFPDTEPGRKIIENPVKPVYLPIGLNVLSTLHFRITDQDDNLLDLRGERITMRFHIRQK